MKMTLWLLLTFNYLLWLPKLAESFWLDECGTVWLIAGGLSELIPRTLMLLHGPLFAFVSAISAMLFGINEYSLRFPSYLGVAASIFLFYKLSAEVMEPEDAEIASALFAAWPFVNFPASEARPYGLVLALVCGTFICLVRAIRNQTSRDWILFSFLSVLTVYTHILFAYVLGFICPYLAAHWPSMSSSNRRLALKSAATIVVLLLPLFFHFKVLLSSGNKYSFTDLPGWREIWEFVAPALPLQGLMVLVAASVILIHGRIQPGISGRDKQILLFCGFFGAGPMIFLFAASWLSGSGMFVERYLTPAIPGVVLIWSWMLGKIYPAFVRYVCLIFIVAIIVVVRIGFGPSNEGKDDDWRSALKRAAEIGQGQDSALVVYTGFVEAKDLQKLSNPVHKSYLLAPLTAYPVTASTTIVLPFDKDQAAQGYWRTCFEREVSTHDSYTVVLRGLMSGPWWGEFLSRDGSRHGYRLVHSERFGVYRTMALLHFVRE